MGIKKTNNNIKLNEKSEKNKIRNRRINIFIVALIIASIIAGFAYAKYISTVNGNGTLSVAKWSFKVNNKFDSFGALDMGRNTYTAETIANGKLAPGTQGKFYIRIDATGTDTALDYKVRFSNIINKPTHMYFKIGTTRYENLTDMETALSGTIAANGTKVVTQEIQWFWDYETGTGATVSVNDEIDTNDGKLAKDFKFDVAVTGTQNRPISN